MQGDGAGAVRGEVPCSGTLALERGRAVDALSPELLPPKVVKVVPGVSRCVDYHTPSTVQSSKDFAVQH